MKSDYFNLAVKNLKKRRLRSWMTMLGIVLSIATIFILVSMSIGLQNAVEEQFKLLGADKFFIQPRGQFGPPGSTGAVELTITDVETIEKVPGVKAVAYATVGNAKVEFHDEVRFFAVVGIPEKGSEVFIETGIYKIDEGRFLKSGDSNSAVLGSQYKYNNIFKTPVAVGEKIIINGQDFKVRGVLQTTGSPPDDRNILIPIDEFRQLFNISTRIDQIVVQIEPGQNLDEVAQRVEKKLRNERDVNEKNQDFTILTPKELLETFGNILTILTSFLFAIAAISLLVGGIGIANTMFTSVLERTKEIGTMKAVGARNSDILLIFLIESGLLGLIGGILGVILGASIAKTVEIFAKQQLATNLVQAAFPIWLILGCLAFAFLSGAISGIWPAWRASRLKTVDALRYE